MRIVAATILAGVMLAGCADTPPARSYGGSSGGAGPAPSALPPPGSAPSPSSAPLPSGSSASTRSAAPTGQASSGNPAPQGEKYGSDKSYCQAQATDQMKTRRTVDYGRSEVFQGQMDRYGTAALPDRMADYSDTRKFESYYGDCMAARGWTTENPANDKWWNRGIKF